MGFFDNETNQLIENHNTVLSQVVTVLLILVAIIVVVILAFGIQQIKKSTRKSAVRDVVIRNI